MQAARGASLTSSDRHPEASRPVVRRTFVLVALTAYLLDVATKVLAVEHLAGREPVEVVGRFFQFAFTRNPGAAFSTGENFTVALSCLAVVGVVVVLVVSRRLRRSALWAIALGLLLAGIAGNLTDRLLREPGPMRGHVIDMLMLPNWPIFNVADVCINVGAGLVVLQAFRGIRVDGTRDTPAEADASAEQDASS